MHFKNQIILLTAVVFGLVSCTDNQPKDYAQIQGKVEKTSNLRLIRTTDQNIKNLDLDETGSFKDTVKSVDGSFYQLVSDQNSGFVFLKNGYDLTVVFDGENQAKSFSGEGADTNNYLLKKIALIEKIMDPEMYYNLPESEFQNAFEDAKKQLTNILDNAGNLDSTIASQERMQNENFFQYLESTYPKERAMRVKFASGKPSPTFNNYENYKGGTTSLSDLKGKYVYIDMWATWCGPCKKEIPYLKELEEKYQGNNIHFVSISIDKPNKHDAWKEMVKEKELSGIQLYAGEDLEFQREYQINAIPRFILIDPQGNIVSANAPRPSSGDQIEGLLNSLKGI